MNASDLTVVLARLKKKGLTQSAENIKKEYTLYKEEKRKKK